MKHNKLRSIRTKLAITQAALAKRAGTSQQQIQRIEDGQAARLDLAVRICNALDTPLEKVFPGVGRFLRRVGAAGPKMGTARMLTEAAPNDLDEAGIDGDPRVWFLKIQLQNGFIRTYRVSGPERRRIFLALQPGEGDSADEPRFLCFDAEDCAVALNRHELAYVHFLFELPAVTRESDEPLSEVRVYFRNTTEPLALDVEPDVALPADSESDALGDEGQLRSALFAFDAAPSPDDVIILEDIDGEDAMIRVGAIALFEVPQSLILSSDGSEEEPGSREEPSGLGFDRPRV
jgi:DNA-binding XRE family transcriptional regulator